MRPHLLARTTILVVFLVSASASAQMAGDYTVDPAGTGARNFKTFAAAIHSMYVNKIGGPVKLIIAPGTYSERIQLSPLPGLASHSLTLQSAVLHGAILTAPANTVIHSAYSTFANPVRNVILDGLRFSSANTAIEALTPIADFVVKNCRFSGLRSYAIHAEPSEANRSFDWEIHHNRFDPGSSGNYRPILFIRLSGISIHHNDIRFAGHRSIFIATHSSVLATPCRIYNNLITGSLPNDPNAGAAIELVDGALDVEINHNTFVIASARAGSTALRVSGALTRPHRIFGNNFVQTNLGACIAVKTVSPYFYFLDNNLYFNTKSGPLIAVEVTGAKYKTLASWQLASGHDKFSVAADPKFRSATDFHLTKASPGVGKAGSTPSYANTDFEDATRNDKRDIGAYEYDPYFRIFGKGCPGSGGFVPEMGWIGLPRLGKTTFLKVDKTLGRATAWLAVGVSAKTWGSIPLPIRFGSGCDLLVSPDLLLNTGMVTGTAGPGKGIGVQALKIPNDSRVLGTFTYLQWAIVDPVAQGIGLAFSDAIVLSPGR
jgi:hypothetical protein